MVHFREVQYFRQRWLWLVLVVVVAATTVELVNRVQASGLAAEWGFLLLWVVVAGVVPALLWTSRLRTEVRSDGIHVRFRPFHLRDRVLRASELARAEAVEYRPILEYGGWGIRLGPAGWAWNVSGRQGVRLTLANGRHILVGSQRAEELARVIESVLAAPGSRPPNDP